MKENALNAIKHSCEQVGIIFVLNEPPSQMMQLINIKINRVALFIKVERDCRVSPQKTQNSQRDRVSSFSQIPQLFSAISKILLSSHKSQGNN